MTKRIDKEAGLELCPFCGGEATIEYQDEFRAYRAHCTRTGCEYGTPDYWFDTEADAITAWNRRSGERIRHETDCPVCNSHLIIIEGNTEDEKGLYTALRSKVEQVRDEVKKLAKDESWGAMRKTERSQELHKIANALTRLLDEPETETEMK